MLLIVAGTVGGYVYWRVIGGMFTRTDVNLDPAAGKALNVLLVGSDSREGLDDPLDVERFGDVGGKRADTIILAQLVPSAAARRPAALPARPLRHRPRRRRQFAVQDQRGVRLRAASR